MEEQEHSTKLFEHLANRRIVNAMTDPVLVKNYGDVGKQFEFEVRRELTWPDVLNSNFAIFSVGRRSHQDQLRQVRMAIIVYGS